KGVNDDEMNGNGQRSPKRNSQQNYEELTKLLSNLIDKQTKTDDDYKTLVTVLETMAEKLENLENQLNKNDKLHHQKLDQLQASLSHKINELNGNYRLIWKAAQYEKQETKKLLDNVIMFRPLTLLKLIGVILITSSLGTWILIKILPPNNHQLEKINGRVNNIEIKLNRMEKNNP
ncbi:hypothetical protein, partial [Crocosphaera sp.]|uniref:hypothetical protein n=1 Tax=Crocosphaera sp. TaxID=2729996 RepID=UPI00257C6861